MTIEANGEADRHEHVNTGTTTATPHISDGDAAQNVVEQGLTDQQEKLTTGDPDGHEQSSAQEQILSLQDVLLNDDTFDVNTLEAPAAGEPSDPTTNNPVSPGGHAQTPEAETVNTVELASAHEHFSTHTYNLPNDTNASQDAGQTAQDESLLSLALSDAPQSLASTRFASVTEDFTPQVSGSITGSGFTPQQLTGDYGILLVDADGQWRFTLDNQSEAVQQLGAGDHENESLRLTDLNGQQHELQITIHGNNDQAVITGIKQGEIKAPGDIIDSPLSAEGQLSVTDTDLGENRFHFENHINTSLGQASIDGQGNWHYSLNPNLDAVISLAEGQRITDVFAVETLDGSRQYIRVEIEGSNNAAQITSIESDNSSELGSNIFQLNLEQETGASGLLGIHDPDFGESSFQASNNLEGSYGTGSIDAQGQWQYNLDINHATVNELGSGETLNDVLSVFADDGTRYDIIVQVLGSDSPVFASAGTPLISQEQSPPLFPDSAIEDELNAPGSLYIWQPDSNSSQSMISDFQTGAGGDTLRLADLLNDSAESTDLTDYLHFQTNDGDTTLEIRPNGMEGDSVHTITLAQVDLGILGQSDQEIIQGLIHQGNLDIL